MNKHLRHLEETNLNYFDHLKYGMSHMLKSCTVVWTSFWHALVPGWYPYIAEGILEKQCVELHKRTKDREDYQKSKK